MRFLLLTFSALGWLTAVGSAAEPASDKPITFDLAGKTREKDGRYEFFIPHPEGPISLLILPEEPRALCAKTSPEGAAKMKEMEKLAVGRYKISGTCVLDPSGKHHVVKTVTGMMPLGPGVVREEDRKITARLEVRGDATAEDWRTRSDMILHAPNDVTYRIPAKKFDPKPSGLDYQHAALLNGRPVVVQAVVQIHPELPYRIKSVASFGPAPAP
jgi:hypothetical protein